MSLFFKVLTFTVFLLVTTNLTLSLISFLRTKNVQDANSQNYQSSDKSENFWGVILHRASWLKCRSGYNTNNWIYTTNHKRIAVNYFWFVMFSGSCGMALATIIRTEMAHPGVGILAGDSLQYLTVVTAHAVIMVFFMIMPLLFGAFANFLLPTQLGVHDVAFPRLNSAAFWFLPAGLIMLLQLACSDRRFQRMNCFNLREAEAILKEKHHLDFIQMFSVKNSQNFTPNSARFLENSLSTIFNKTFTYTQLLFTRNSVMSDKQYIFANHVVEGSNPLFLRSAKNNSSSNYSADKYSMHESNLYMRALRTDSPILKYDYKLGNYLTKELTSMFPHLLVSRTQVTGGIRKSSWYFSSQFIELFNETFTNYLQPYSQIDLSTKSRLSEASVSGALSGFYNMFASVDKTSEFLNTRWVSLNTMDQKLYRMFLTSTIQQRIYANWRELKFSREAWRCKLLASRHQKTLYNRYVNEDGVFWAVERNAKDVLPGWAMITPFSARSRFTAIGKVDIGLMGVFLVLNSSIVSSANFLVTYRYLSSLNNRKLRDARSFFTEGVMVASWMMIAANPMLAIGILMLLSDRHWQTSFFDYSGGGDTVLFQHMFWFFGHPEVYVIMIPAFGFNNTILSFYLRKRVSARASLLYSMYTIAFLGFFVWGHHMYMVGLAHTTRMLFSTLTVMISVPAATKLMHWCVTLVNSSFQIELPLLFALLFIFFFVSGGISGMAVAHTGMDILFHDSFYVIGHFHVMLAGSAMFASFGAFYFYFAAIFGVKFSRIYGYLHCIYYLIGQLMTVIPMFWLGYAGMPRRVLDYPAALGGWHAIVSAGHLLSVAGLSAFFVMIFDSLRQAKAATRSSFGVTRFNTRLNFYLYEMARTLHVQRNGWYIARKATLRDDKDNDSRSLIQLSYSNFYELPKADFILVSKNK